MSIDTESQVEEDRVLLHTDWRGYLKITQALSDSRGVRVSYDRGSLQILTISDEHAHLTALLGDLLKDYMQAADVAYRSGGNQTFKRKDLDRAFEPDNCFWLGAAASVMVGVKRWNPRRHPPPDVAVEVQVIGGLLDRFEIYAALGTLEVWWCHGGTVEVLRLTDEGRYEPCEISPTLPLLPPQVVAHYLGLSATLVDSDISRRFRKWLEVHLATGGR